jgi:hypothetical protein
MNELITVASIMGSGWVLLHVGGPALAEKIRSGSRTRADD